MTLSSWNLINILRVSDVLWFIVYVLCGLVWITYCHFNVYNDYFVWSISLYFCICVRVHHIECACNLLCFMENMLGNNKSNTKFIVLCKCVWNSPVVAFVALSPHQMSFSLSFASSHRFIPPTDYVLMCVVLWSISINWGVNIHDELYKVFDFLTNASQHALKACRSRSVTI